MNPIRTSTAAVLAALALAAVPATAVAHDGGHPFKNCTEAYDNGYSNISEGDEHYGTHLDRDRDGIGCDRPPADFVPREETSGGTKDSSTKDGDTETDDAGAGSAKDGGTKDGGTKTGGAKSDGAKTGDPGTGSAGTDEQGGETGLAETGGSNATPYLAAGGAAVLLAGGGVLFAARRRRGDR